MRARSGVEIAVRENAETQTRRIDVNKTRAAPAAARAIKEGKHKMYVCVARPIFSCTRGLYLMFLNRVCTRSHTWVVTRGGPNEAPGNATERHSGHPAVTRDCPCRRADTTLSCWRCSPDRMNELAQKASIMAGRLVPLTSWALMRYQSYRASKPV